MKLRYLVFGALLLDLVLAVTSPRHKTLTGCTPQQAKAVESVAKDVTLKVAADVCQEIVDPTTEPDWVKLACLAGPDVIKVLLPRQEWTQIRARTLFDAGSERPGPGL